jgi:hypothetical protein
MSLAREMGASLWQDDYRSSFYELPFIDKLSLLYRRAYPKYRAKI